MDEINNTIRTSEILMEKYPELTEKEALKLAIKIEANSIAMEHKNAIEELNQTLSRAYVINDNDPSAFEMIAMQLERMVSLAEQD